MLTSAQRHESAKSIVACQLANGLILWNEGGHCDPWNHVEAAMALDTCDMASQATLAYSWLKQNQLSSGAWYQYYTEHAVEDEKLDANTIAYIAVGVYHHWLCWQDDEWLASMWPCVEAAMRFVLKLQQPSGEIFWALEPDGTPFHYALVTGSSSIFLSLKNAERIAKQIGTDHAWITEAKDLLQNALQNHEREYFAEKDRWAMDWYYPVLCGVHAKEKSQERIWSKWDEFFYQDHGIKCVNDHPWVTTGETAETALAVMLCGLWDQGAILLDSVAQLRHSDGSYFTGRHVPSGVWFPEDERTTYSTAAVLLADAFAREHVATHKVFL